MKSRRILCMTALMLAMLLAMGGCKQAEAKEASTQPVEQVEETEETTKEPTIGESTEEELKAEAEAKAKAEAEKKAAEEAAAKAEAEKKAAEEAAKAEKETVTAQAETTTSGDSAVEAATPAANTASSDEYALNEYGNPSNDIITAGLVDTINPADPQLDSIVRRNSPGYHGSTPIPNPYAKVDPISPFIGMENPPADWPKPQPNGKGEYKWDSETGCWRYYNDLGNATKYYGSLYGGKTQRCSEIKALVGSEAYASGIAMTRGVY